MGNISKQAESDLANVAVLRDVNATERQKQKAFNDLFSTHQRQVGIYFLKNIGDDVVAEDLKMITFEKVHGAIEKYDSSQGVFSTWLYKIAQNTLIDYKRKENFEELSLDALTGKTSEENEGMEFQIKSDFMTPEQEVVKEENAKAVHQAIEGIKNDTIKRLMKYRFIDELSFKEIEELEGTNHNTIRVNVMRGKELLADALATI